MVEPLWNNCVKELMHALPEDDINKWVRPLQAKREKNDVLRLFAPNQFVLDWVSQNCLDKIRTAFKTLHSENVRLVLEVGPDTTWSNGGSSTGTHKNPLEINGCKSPGAIVSRRLNADQTFDHFVEGKSNRMACAVAYQVADQPGQATIQPAVLVRRRRTGQDTLDECHWQRSVKEKLPAQKLPTCTPTVSFQKWSG